MLLELAVVVADCAEAEVIRLDAPLSFWGAFDPRTHEVLDRTHPQCGARLGGKVVVLPGTRGSGGTPGSIAESLRSLAGPAGFICARPDVNIMAGVEVARKLYRVRCPVLVAGEAELARLATGQRVEIEQSGRVRILS